MYLAITITIYIIVLINLDIWPQIFKFIGNVYF